MQPGLELSCPHVHTQALCFTNPRGPRETGPTEGPWNVHLPPPPSFFTACLAGEDTCLEPCAQREPSSIPGDMQHLSPPTVEAMEMLSRWWSAPHGEGQRSRSAQ